MYSVIEGAKQSSKKINKKLYLMVDENTEKSHLNQVALAL